LKILDLRILGIAVRVRCADPYSHVLLSQGYSAFIAGANASAGLEYTVLQRKAPAFELGFNGRPIVHALDEYELLYAFEKHMTMQVQKLRQDLLFLHAAALEQHCRAALLVAPSGTGKSTTAWALTNNGFRYLSDELAPISLATLQVHPYPHALCLKWDPPAPFCLPAETLRTSYTLHVPVELLPGEVCREKTPLSAIFFLRYDPQIGSPQAKPISRAEAAARIYSNALNLLAHPRYGLDAALKIAQHSRCFELFTGDLGKTCGLIQSRLQG